MFPPEDETAILFRVRRTVMQMLRARGYLVADIDIEMTRTEFEEKFGRPVKRQDLTTTRARKNDSSDQIYVYFESGGAKNVGIKTITDIAEDMKSAKISRAILVFRTNMTPFASTGWRTEFSGSGMFHMEIFQQEELLVNIAEHTLIPEHQVLTEEQKKGLLKQYTVKETEIPRIQVTDPIARFYGMTRGQVVKIIRPSETAGRYVTYRYVV